MNQHDFDILLQKYLAGECGQEEEKQLIEWSEKTIANAPLNLADTEHKALERKIWKKINANTLARRHLFSIYVRRYASIAACLMLVAGIGAFFWMRNDHADGHGIVKNDVPKAGFTLTQDITEVKNTSAGEEVIALEDGTVVTLAKASSIRYPRHFEPRNRRVELEGEAVFNVKRDITRPFFVYTGELVTQVLGTSFKISSFESAKTIEVQVLTGRVSVYENQQKSPQTRNGVILRPNQKITFDKQSKKLVPELVAAPAVVELPGHKMEFAFEESPLANVLDAIQKAYDIEIVVENPAIQNCTFTGDITGLPLHTQLRFICKSVNSSYELRGTTFFINGDGCPK